MGAESLSKANQSCYFFPLPNIALMKMIIVIHYICRVLSYTSSPSNHKTALWGKYHSPNYRENSHSETNLVQNGTYTPLSVSFISAFFTMSNNLKTWSLWYSDRKKVLWVVRFIILEWSRKMSAVENKNLLFCITYICLAKCW